MFTMLKYAPYIFREAFAKVGRFNLWEDNSNNAIVGLNPIVKLFQYLGLS